MTVDLVPLADIEIVEDNEAYLAVLAARIREHYEQEQDCIDDLTDARLAIGRDLIEARALFATDNGFGAWFRAQKFPFSRQWGHTLRVGAEYETEVRAAVSTQVATGKKTVNFKAAVKTATAPLAIEAAADGDTASKRKGVATVDKSQSAVREREAKLRELAESGHTSHQIAKLLHIGRPSVIDMAHRIGVTIPADEMLGGSRRPDSNRVISETVLGLEGYCMGLSLIDYDTVDREQIETWTESLAASLKAIAILNSRLKGLH